MQIIIVYKKHKEKREKRIRNKIKENYEQSSIRRKKLRSSYFEREKKNSKFFDFLIRRADEMCMKVDPCLDDMEEFKESMWEPLADSIVAIKYEQAASDFRNQKAF